ncbi:MAG: DNA (cytosine-5-)-methyltransferase [Prevotellaceae bacterium]|nr:DNA (cytosine-5-)-methyltransferase [Prevotellaceae bacterium]
MRVSGAQILLTFDSDTADGQLRLLSLFSGCGGMDIGFEGGFLAPRKSFPCGLDRYVEREVGGDWILLKRTRFRTVFANDILPEAQLVWASFMSRFGHEAETYRLGSIVDLVRLHEGGAKVFPEGIDIVTGGFPCQDFSVAGKRMGFQSLKDDWGKRHPCSDRPEVSRGTLYQWMREVVSIVKPKVFIAENVKGLVNLGEAKDIIQRDFQTAAQGGYIVLPPRVLDAAQYGVPERRERVIFIGIRRDALLPEALKALSQPSVSSDYDPYPSPTHSQTTYVTAGDVLSHLTEPEESDDPSQQTFSRAKFLPKGQGQREIQLDSPAPTIRSEHHGNIEYRRLSSLHGGRHAEELAQGLTERRLTPRECALLQTFPPDFPLVEPGRLSASAAYKLVGNAVPPVLAYRVATRLEELWQRLFF